MSLSKMLLVAMLLLSLIGGGRAYSLGVQGIRRAPLRTSTPNCVEELNMAETATSAIDQLLAMLSDEAEPPKTLLPLKAAISGGDGDEISAALYAVMIEQALDYDVKDGLLYPTDVDFSNKDDERVREKVAYIYSYGIQMFQRDLIKPEPLQKLVIERIASRVGLDGPGLDKWLEIPAAM